MPNRVTGSSWTVARPIEDVMPTQPTPEEVTGEALAALVAWYADMGCDVALADAPVDRFAEVAAERARRTAPRPAPEVRSPAMESRPRPPASESPSVPGADQVHRARELASGAGNLEELRALVEAFDGCNLKLTARNTVFGDGNPKARLMLVGEAPGRDEDQAGRPFVGRSGQLLDRMLEALGLSRDRDVYIANTIYWQPPGNRDPSDVEVAICRPFIRRQIELVAPDVLVCLGRQSALTLLEGQAAKSGIKQMRGRWYALDIAGRAIPVLPTYHPAFLLRTPIEKRMVWRDLLAARARLRTGAPAS